MTDGTTMTFGKYRGVPIALLIERAPRYLIWAHENVAFFKLSPMELADCRARTGHWDTGEDDDSDRPYRYLDNGGCEADFGNN